MATGRDAVEWAREGAERGAGEILLTSMDRDGTKDGYDLRADARGRGRRRHPRDRLGRRRASCAHLSEAITEARADAVLVASIFHYGEYRVREAKEHLRAAGIPVRA